MRKIKTYSDCKIARSFNGLTLLIEGPQELMEVMDGAFFEDNCFEESLETMPKLNGFYIADVEVWYEQGYDSDGYPHNGESDIDLKLINLREYMGL